MITTLKNYFGYSNIIAGESNVNIDDVIAGIQPQVFEHIQDDADYDLSITWERIENRAIRLFEQDIKKFIKAYFRNYTYIDHRQTAEIRDYNVIARDNVFTGWYFDNYLTLSKSPHLAINFNSIQIYLIGAQDFDIIIANAATGDEIYRQSIEGKDGLNFVNIKQTFPLHRYPKLWIGYDASQINTIKASNSAYGRAKFVVTNRSFPLDKEPYFLNFTENNDNGLIVNYNYDCSLDYFVQQRINLFETPAIYKFAIEFCNERIRSQNVNRFTLLEQEEAMQLKEDLQKEYDQMVKDIFHDLKINDICGVCFKSSKNSRTENTIP